MPRGDFSSRQASSIEKKIHKCVCPLAPNYNNIYSVIVFETKFGGGLRKIF